MFEFQDDGIAFLRAHDRALLGDEPGLGKTRQLLLAAEAPCLVIAPKMVLNGGTWDDEITKWRPDWEPGVDVVQVAYSSLTDRVEAGVNAKGARYTKPVGRARSEYRRPWASVILDEAHYVKGRKTLWTDAVRQVTAGVDRVLMATGTPIPNWAHELFVLACLLKPQDAVRGGRLGSYWRWVGQWFDTTPTRWSRGMPSVGEFLDDTPEGWLRFYEENLGDQYLARRWEDVLSEIPPMRFQTIECPMTASQAKAYKDLKRQYLAVIEETGTEVVAWSAGGLHEKMKQVTTGIEIVDPQARSGSGKLERLASLLEDHPQQTFIAAHYRATVEACHRVATERGRRSAFIHGGTPEAERKRIVRAFQSGELDVLVGSIETVAEGLNFEQCHLVYRVERAWRPSRNEQVVRRIRRLSNLEPKLCVDLVTPDSIDSGMLPVLEAKTDQQMKALRAREFAALL